MFFVIRTVAVTEIRLRSPVSNYEKSIVSGAPSSDGALSCETHTTRAQTQKCRGISVTDPVLIMKYSNITHQVRRADGREAEREQERAHLRCVFEYFEIRTGSVTEIPPRFCS
jgi:hypothetical protein